MKFSTTFIVSILTSSIYGLATGPIVRGNVDVEARAGAQACGDPRHAIPLLRASRQYSLGQVDHFYTTNATEFQIAVTHLRYTDEGTTGYVFSGQEPHSIPLYRLFNGATLGHLYTTNAKERNYAAHHLGYHNEGIAGYVYPDTACDASPLYRLYNGAQTDHLYTMSTSERENAIKKLGYTQEGIAAYIFPVGKKAE